ncbi:MAG: hypothetical protein KIT09_20705 [Bryobacteraceae bacterium]|nr:hypothetical protein [Bryobacteraceae bacterium]
MAEFIMQMVDSTRLQAGTARYKYQVAVQRNTSMAAGDTQSWRQRPPFDRQYFKTAAGSWRRLKLWGRVDGIALENGKHCAAVLHSCKSGKWDIFPSVGQWGLGILWESQDKITHPAHNVLWYIDHKEEEPVDPGCVWIGGGGKYGGMLPVWGREAMHGWIFNLADFSKRFYVQAEANRWGVGLGGSGGVVFLVATGPDPRKLLGEVNGAFDFTLSLAKRWDQYVKHLAEGGKCAKYLELGQFAIQAHNKAGILTNDRFESAANAAKLVFSGAAIDWKTTSLTALDIAGDGLEATICFTQSKVTMVAPF